jgi:hypothetical protein
MLRIEGINKMKLLFCGLFFKSYILEKLLLFRASHPKPQIPSVGCARILPAESHSIDE